ncbi:hypothetical protein IU448_15235 [Nocardia flavorosea]|uniref:hypothetical protein n=1 Tax=Nocardia flavorosea TaxID=53429 RepID=UPI0018948246|nr:hypothetical protein [Nocardia flavorosea]MBF6350360.1 hypothetical protein [Nocardia flavorosea]
MTARRRPAAAAPKETTVVEDDFVTKAGGVEIRLPSLSNLPFGLLRKSRNLSKLELMFVVIEDVLTDKQLAAIDKLRNTEITQLVNEWREHSGIDLGES